MSAIMANFGLVTARAENNCGNCNKVALFVHNEAAIGG